MTATPAQKVEIVKAAHQCWAVKVNGESQGVFRTRAQARSFATRFQKTQEAEA